MIETNDTSLQIKESKKETLNDTSLQSEESKKETLDDTSLQTKENTPNTAALGAKENETETDTLSEMPVQPIEAVKYTQERVFEALTSLSMEDKKRDVNIILDIPVNMTVELGKAKLTIKELLNLTQGSIIPLEGLAGEALDILINGYLIAQGEVVVVGDNYGVRITDIITPSERMKRLSR